MSDKILFKKWLVNTKGTAANHITHTSLSGGSFKVPFSERPFFFEQYLSAVKNNVLVYMTERISGHTGNLFHFFIDFDFDFDTPKVLNHVEWNKLIEHIKNTISKSSKKISDHIKQFNYVVSVRWSTTNEIYKLHVNFPKLVVNKEQAVYFRSEIIKDLSVNNATIISNSNYFVDNMEKIIDKQVYMSNGLRMLSSQKPRKMIKKDEPCDYDKYYHIVEFDEDDDQWISINSITIDDLTSCSLTPDPDASLVDENLCIETLPESNILSQLDGVTESEVNEKDKLIICKFIETNYHFKMYQVIELKFIHNSICAIIDSDYCDIKKAKHNGNKRMRIVINNSGSYQKCFSTKLPICAVGKHNHIAFNKFPNDIQIIVKALQKTSSLDPPNQLEAFNNIFSQPFESINNINMTMGKPTTTHVGWKCRLTENLYCPVCKVYHDSPQNYLLVTGKGQKMIGCCIDIDIYFPDPPLKVETNYFNILFQNITNNYLVDGDQQLSTEAKFDKVEPITDDHELNSLIYMSLYDPIAFRIADVFYHLAKNKFAVDSKNNWWVWKTRWVMGQTEISTFCNAEVGNIYEKVQKYYNTITSDKTLAAARERCIFALRKRIGDKDKSLIIQETSYKFKEVSYNWEQQLNANKNVLAFVSGLYDFEKGEYRAIKSSDYTSLSTGYDLPDSVDENVRSEIMNFLKSIMPNDEEVHYLLKWLASCLDGYNKYEIFTILTGVGRNGKGVLCELMAQSLGGDTEYGYAHDIQASMLTHTRPGSANPTPDLLFLEGMRWVCGSEPEKGSSINGGFLKLLTGNDPISGRYCHSNSKVKFKPQHSLVIQCNEIPRLDSEDEAIWDRGRIINFPYKFVDEPREPHEKEIDRSLKQKIKTRSPQFMLLLIEYYKIYLIEGLKPSKGVMEMSRKVRKENDTFIDFIEDTFEITEHKSIMTCSEINALYKIYTKTTKTYIPHLNEALQRYGFKFSFNCNKTDTYKGTRGYTNIKQKSSI